MTRSDNYFQKNIVATIKRNVSVRVATSGVVGLACLLDLFQTIPCNCNGIIDFLENVIPFNVSIPGYILFPLCRLFFLSLIS